VIASEVDGIEVGDHVVQFYARELDLVEAVGGYLSAAVRAGEVAIVIATPEHRAAFEAELAAGGLDAQAARGDGRYLELDAAQTLALFAGGGSVDAEAYFAVVGTLVRQAVATGRRVRAYGEMVALLWDAGNVLAAIELETLWNELGRQVPFSLYCAYPKASVSHAGQSQALQDVCHLHSSVIGSIDARTPPQPAPTPTMQAAVNLPAQPTAPGAARRFVVATLSNWGYSGALGQYAASIVTELATNAVVHTARAFEVSLRAEGATVRILVQDAGPGSPADLAGIQARTGHGLALVAGLADRWGVHAQADGKVVWAQLYAPHAPHTLQAGL